MYFNVNLKLLTKLINSAFIGEYMVVSPTNDMHVAYV